MFVIKRGKIPVAVCLTEKRALELQSMLWIKMGQEYKIVEVKEIREIITEPQKPINSGLDEEQTKLREVRKAS